MAAAVKERAVEDLARLDPIIADIAEEEQLEGPRPQRLFMWSSGAKRLLEILFWATAGILVRLIITIGRYLRLYRFYGNGIPQHRALLFCAPFLTLVYVLLISMVRIDSDAVALDLSNPQILAGISFLLAATPWGLWERLQGVAERVLGENDQAPRKGGK